MLRERIDTSLSFLTSAAFRQIEILCHGDPMGDELSLTFITRTRWFYMDQMLTLKYRLEGEGAK